MPLRSIRGSAGWATTIGVVVCLLGIRAVNALAAPNDEAPTVVAAIEIEGNRTVATDRIRGLLKTHPGREFDQRTVDADVRRLYGTYLFYDVEVNRKRTDKGTVLVFHVIERPIILEVQYLGAEFFKEKDLAKVTGLRPGKPMDPGFNKEMARRIESKYREKAFPFASVELAEGGVRGDTRVVMKITEGPRTAIDKIAFEGNRFVGARRLLTKIDSRRKYLVRIGNYGKYDPEQLEQDITKLIEYYRNYGYLDVRVSRRLEWTKDREGVEVTFVIDEGNRYRVGDVRFAGVNVFDKERLQERLELRPGEVVEQAALRKDLQVIRDTYGDNGFINAVVQPNVRFDEKEGVANVVYQVKEDIPRKVGQVIVEGNEITKQKVILSNIDLVPGELARTTELRRSQQRLIETRLFQTDAASGTVPTVQFHPDNDPLAEFQDVLISVQEAQTGSLLFGVGVNSDSGVGGSIVLHERNFDIARVPMSLNDIWSGKAFRGAGQEMRLEAVPGSQVQRYSLTISEPRLFGWDYRLSGSGYYYKRIFSPYDEQRVGFRGTFGKRFSRTIGVAATLRAESVEISSPVIPTPQDITDVLGDNFLSSIRFSADHDTRDSHLNPGSGHFIEVSYEQAFGDFDFPRIALEGRQYWTAHRRADGSGKHVISYTGQIAYTGEDTPVFERFYAGGFQTIRGFDFRGVGPTSFGTEVGGDFMLLNSLQYQLPLTADDSLGWVFFVDSGTVESDVEIVDYRVAAGFGLRVQVPQMGPVPLAFDFAFPIAKNGQDDTQVFSFFLGLFR